MLTIGFIQNSQYWKQLFFPLQNKGINYKETTSVKVQFLFWKYI